jgi:putative ABC transport system permease protein
MPIAIQMHSLQMQPNQLLQIIASDTRNYYLVRAGIPVDRTLTSKTHEHPLASTVNAILGILMTLGVLIVFLSSSLIANTLNALLNQHLCYIGVMKLVGGRNRQILIMYLALIISFGVLALLVAVPLGGQGAYGLAAFIANELRFNLLGYRIVPIALAIQIAIGILVPLVAGLVPVMNGSKVTVLKAISGDLARGEGKPLHRGPKRESPWERFQTRVTVALSKRGIHIPRPLLISFRNTFRRRGRLLLTLFTLTMGGAIFIAVFNVRVTLHNYIGAIGNYFKADVELDFTQPYRTHEIQLLAMQIPGVQSVEGWQGLSADLLYPNGSIIDTLNIAAPLEYVSQVNDLANQSASFHIEMAQHDRPYQDRMANTIDQYFCTNGFNVLQSQRNSRSPVIGNNPQCFVIL